ncbi:MAG: PIG-L family deacetylase [Bacteroidetes bacterium]|nr:PIG-L family deacetylase [Bacteroidota bacterium]
MTGVRQILEYLSVRRLRQRARQIVDLATDPSVTVYPRPIDFHGAARRVVVLTPHADDETFGAGGTILRHRQRGDAVTVVLFSDNVASIDDDHLTDDDKRDIREREFRNAMDMLGVGDSILLRLGNRSFRDRVYPQSVFRRVIEKEPDVLYLPSLFDNHHDHRILNLWFLRALQDHPRVRPLVRGYEVWSPLPATAAVDITRQIERKRAAMHCYPSQQEAIDYQHHIDGLNAYRAMTFGGRSVRYAEAFLELPADAYLELGISTVF